MLFFSNRRPCPLHTMSSKDTLRILVLGHSFVWRLAQSKAKISCVSSDFHLTGPSSVQFYGIGEQYSPSFASLIFPSPSFSKFDLSLTKLFQVWSFPHQAFPSLIFPSPSFASLIFPSPSFSKFDLSLTKLFQVWSFPHQAFPSLIFPSPSFSKFDLSLTKLFQVWSFPHQAFPSLIFPSPSFSKFDLSLVAQCNPTILLLEIGSNDLSNPRLEGTDLATNIFRLAQQLHFSYRVSHIIVSQILPRRSPPQFFPSYNAKVKQLNRSLHHWFKATPSATFWLHPRITPPHITLHASFYATDSILISLGTTSCITVIRKLSCTVGR